jgi:hypothetical protein
VILHVAIVELVERKSHFKDLVLTMFDFACSLLVKGEGEGGGSVNILENSPKNSDKNGGLRAERRFPC